MKAKNAKAKGNRLENYLVDYWRENIDKDTHRTPASGSGIDKNDVIIPNYKIEVEAKNQNTIHLIKDWEQLQRQLTGYNKGVLAIRNPKQAEFKETLIVLLLEDYTELLKASKEETEVITSLDRDTEWALKGLISSCKKLLKKINNTKI